MRKSLAILNDVWTLSCSENCQPINLLTPKLQTVAATD